MTDRLSDGHYKDIPKADFPLKAEQYASKPVPTIEEFEQLWGAWDTVTRHMILEKEMLSKPINLRNCCLFYLGHIPTFLDIHLSRATDGVPTPPAYYKDIFERGIDPDVENPELCHAHSEAPSEWPSLEEILEYQHRVRERTRSLYASEDPDANRTVARACWIGFEHEGMHVRCVQHLVPNSDIVSSHASGDFTVHAFAE